MGELPLNQILCGDCREVMTGFPANSVDLVVTSPPYWGLRDYGSETVRVWGGLHECEHEWGESLPAAKSGHKNIGFAERSQQNYRGGGHKTVTIAEKHHPSEAGQFCSKCGAWWGSLGLEPHPQLYIDHLVEICREIKRILKPTGTFWLNLGDSYCSKVSAGSGGLIGLRGEKDRPSELYVKQPHGFKRNFEYDGGWLQPKQLLMIPSRVAIALQHEGWILRNDLIWYKPNHMPSSVKDRLTCAYEHVFLLVKARRYYFDLDAIRKPHSASTIQRITQPNVMNQPGGDKQRELRGEGGGNASRSADMVKSLARNYEKLTKHDIAVGRIGNFSYTDPLHTKEYHPQGKNPGDLWRIPTTPFPGAHFATFPLKLIEPIVKAGCPLWICSRCGKPRERIRLISRPTYQSKEDPTLKTGRAGLNRYREGVSYKRLNIGQRKIAEKLRELAKNRFVEMRKCFGSKWDHWIRTDDSGARIPMLDDWIELKRIFPSLEIFDSYIISEPKEGWSDCGCGEGWVGGVVLDPFAGSGTALRVARKLGRRFIGIEIKLEYAEMARQRVRGRYKPVPDGVTPLDQIMEDKK